MQISKINNSCSNTRFGRKEDNVPSQKLYPSSFFIASGTGALCGGAYKADNIIRSGKLIKNNIGEMILFSLLGALIGLGWLQLCAFANKWSER